MNKKKVGIILAVVLLVIACGAGLIWYFVVQQGVFSGNSADKVYVESVKAIMNAGAGVNNRYSGVVESQETWDVKKNEDKTVKELFVEQGAAVEEGTPLFEYDTEELKSQLSQAKLELEGIDNEVSGYNSQISELRSDRNSAPESEKFQYTTQIQSLENSIKQSEFSKESKNIEIEKLEESIENSVVVSKIAGIVKSISENGYDQFTGEALPYISILATGDYRVKGTINEQNVGQIMEGQPVIIRSRIDETQTWEGSVSKIDLETQLTDNNNGYSDTGSAETATKYPFYIALDNVEGLILGQHIFIELDNGQTEEKEGIWLYESYIVIEGNEEENLEGNEEDLEGTEEDLEGNEEDLEGNEEGIEENEEGTEKIKAFVWVANSKNKLEKRSVELGEYDEEMYQYEIVSGLTEDDYIAAPMDNLYEGVTTVTSMEEVDYEAPMYNEEGEGAEGEYPEGMTEEDMMNEGMMDEDMMNEGMMDEGAMEEIPLDDLGEDNTENPDAGGDLEGEQ